MTGLEDRVQAIVASIPPGRVATYGAVARLAGTSARAAGRVLNRSGRSIPWWRAVTAEGRPYGPALERVRVRFAEEATPLMDGGEDLRVDLARGSWSADGRRDHDEGSRR